MGIQQASTKMRVRIQFRDGLDMIHPVDVHYNDQGEPQIPWQFEVTRADGYSALVEESKTNDYRRVRMYNEVGAD